MNINNITCYEDILFYIKENNIKNIEIRFLDQDFKVRSFSISCNILQKKIFNCKFFKFSKFSLLNLSYKRAFKDPFLVNPTLVFFTNLLEHNTSLNDLNNSLTKSYKLEAYIIRFFFTNKNSNYENYNYSVPPFDNNRNIRDEIVEAASNIGISVILSFSIEKNGNTLLIKSATPLELLDNIEKTKYVILMVASVYNTPVDISSGIFAESCLLNN